MKLSNIGVLGFAAVAALLFCGAAKADHRRPTRVPSDDMAFLACESYADDIAPLYFTLHQRKYEASERFRKAAFDELGRAINSIELHPGKSASEYQALLGRKFCGAGDTYLLKAPPGPYIGWSPDAPCLNKGLPLTPAAKLWVDADQNGNIRACYQEHPRTENEAFFEATICRTIERETSSYLSCVLTGEASQWPHPLCEGLHPAPADEIRIARRMLGVPSPREFTLGELAKLPPECAYLMHARRLPSDEVADEAFSGAKNIWGDAPAAGRTSRAGSQSSAR